MNSRIHVAVGVIVSQDKKQVLISKRTPKQHLAGLWEFPGGKVEKGENVEAALKREVYEELGIIVISCNQLITVSHDYPNKNVYLDVWLIEEWNGEPVAKEEQEFTWANINELSSFEFPEANKHIIQTLSLSPYYLISPESYGNITDFISVIGKSINFGVKLFQLRLKTRDEPEYSQLIKRINELTKKHNVKFIVNGKPNDIDKFNANGIHLKSEYLYDYNKRPINEEFILGASCHNEAELLQAEKINVNYAFISPVKKTGSHPEAIAIGWQQFKVLSEKVKFPVYALGGMSLDDLEIARQHNAYGIAMISAIWGKPFKLNN